MIRFNSSIIYHFTYSDLVGFWGRGRGRGRFSAILHLEQQINDLRDTQRKYLSILRLSRTFNNHFQQVVATQRKFSSFSNVYLVMEKIIVWFLNTIFFDCSCHENFKIHIKLFYYPF